jgi:hypothetical protein
MTPQETSRKEEACCHAAAIVVVEVPCLHLERARDGEGCS